MKKFLRSLSLVAALVLSLSAATAAETVIVDADFSVLTEGSEESPQMFSYSSQFTAPTGLTGWMITSAGQAGGSLYIADGGNVQTNNLSGISSGNGAIKVTLVVKLNKADMGMVQLKWGYTTTYTQDIEGSDWTTVEFVFPAASYGNRGTISPYLVFDGIFVKSMKIAQSPEFIPAPVANQPSNADGTSFTATWKAVTGATKYFIDVYSYNAAGDKVLFIENQECTTTSYKVEGLDPDTTYYFVVRAANESGVSNNSEEIEVVEYISSLDAPVVSLTSCDADGNFTATWGAVAKADSYSVTVFKEETLPEAGEANVLTEDFNAFTTDDYIYTRHLEVLNQPGWDGFGMACMPGAIGIDPFSGDGYIITPALNLSDDNGNITISITMAGRVGTSFNTGNVAKFSTIDADDNESTPVEVTINEVGFADYTVKLTGGTTATKIKISSDKKIFIDNIEVKQMKPAGFVSSSTYFRADTEATSYTGKVEFAKDTQYKLVAVANGRTVSGGEISGIYSDASEPVTISATSGIENVADSASDVAIVKAGRGAISVTTPVAVTVEIYDISGRLVSAQPVAEGTSTISVDASGLVIVKAGSAVAKIAL